MEDFADCPLCCTELDVTDRAIQYCECGYQMCLWCYHHILEEASKASLAARCPNCRSEYDEEKIQMQHIDAEQLEEEKRKLKEKDKPGKAGSTSRINRANLTNVRVVQPNLVYAVGLSLDICHEEALRDQQYFGQFGRTVKISVNRNNQYGSALARHGHTGSAYVTYKRPEDALRCIKALDGAVWKGKPVRACFGTTKYCNAFLKGLPCNNPDCLYLHDIADEADCLTKEEVAAGLLPARFMAMGAANTFKPRLTINAIPNPATAAAQAAAAQAVAEGKPTAAVAAAAAAAGGVSRPVAAASQAVHVLTVPRHAHHGVRGAAAPQLHDGGGSDGSSAGAWGSPGTSSLAATALSPTPMSSVVAVAPAARSVATAGLSWASISSAAPSSPASAALPPPPPPPAGAAAPPPVPAVPPLPLPAALTSVPPPSDAQEWPELSGGPGGSGSGTTSPQQEESSEGVGGSGSSRPSSGLARMASQNGSSSGSGTMAEQLARAQSQPQGRAADRPKKLLPLSSPAKLKPLGRAPSGALRSPSAPTPLADHTPAAVGASSSSTGTASSTSTATEAAVAAAGAVAAKAVPVAAAVAAKAVLVANGTAGKTGAGSRADAVGKDATPAAVARVLPLREQPQPQQHRVAATEATGKPAARLRPPPGFGTPATTAAATVLAVPVRPKKVAMPPPGFGGPATSTASTPASTIAVSPPALSQHISLDATPPSLAAASAAAAAAVAAAKARREPAGKDAAASSISGSSAQATVKAAAAAGGKPVPASSHKSSSGMAGGALARTGGSASAATMALPRAKPAPARSLGDAVLPEEDDLFGGGPALVGEARSTFPALSNGSVGGSSASAVAAARRQRSRFAFAQAVEEAAVAEQAASMAAASQATQPSGFGLSVQQQLQPQHPQLQQAAMAPTNRLLQEPTTPQQQHPQAQPLYQQQHPSQLAAQLAQHQQLPLHQQYQPPPQQAQQQPQDAGAFFKSLFPTANVSVASSFELGLRHQAAPQSLPPQQLLPQVHQLQQQHLQPHLQAQPQQHYQLVQAPQAQPFQLAPPQQQQQQQHLAPPPPGFGGSYGGSGGGLFSSTGTSPAGAQLGSSPGGPYNPIAGMFPQHQQQASALAPGLALLRQLQGGSACAPQVVQHQQVHVQHQQVAQHQHQQDSSFSGGFSDPAIMAVGAGHGTASPTPLLPGFGMSCPPGF